MAPLRRECEELRAAHESDPNSSPNPSPNPGPNPSPNPGPNPNPNPNPNPSPSPGPGPNQAHASARRAHAAEATRWATQLESKRRAAQERDPILPLTLTLTLTLTRTPTPTPTLTLTLTLTPKQERDVALQEVSTMAMELDALQAGHSPADHSRAIVEPPR